MPRIACPIIILACPLILLASVKHVSRPSGVLVLLTCFTDARNIS
jgi:hypothetical protein